MWNQTWTYSEQVVSTEVDHTPRVTDDVFYHWDQSLRPQTRVVQDVKLFSMTKYEGMWGEELIRLKVWPKRTRTGSLMVDERRSLSTTYFTADIFFHQHHTLHIKKKSNDWHSNTFHAENNGMYYYFLNASQTTFPHEASFTKLNHA